MARKGEKIREQIAARVAEEEQTAPAPKDEGKKQLPMKFLLTCLFANRVGDATLYASLHRGQYVYVERWGRWLRWAGHHWQEDLNNRCALSAVEKVCLCYQRIIVEQNLNPEDDLYKLIHKRINTLRDKSGRDNVLDLAATIEDPLCIEGPELDNQPYLLACPNCVVDLRTGDSAPGQPEQYILKHCPTDWRGIDEPWPALKSFLSSCFDGDLEMVAYILRLLGYGLLGVRDDHIWAMFHGPRGRNGKDTLMKLCFRILGKDLAIKVPTAMLLQQSFQRSGSQPEPDIMALRGAKLAFASEAEARQQMAMAKIKDLTGGAIISARGINDKLMSQWEQTHLLFLMTNEVPKMRSDDDAFWSRMHAVHWPIRFVDNPSDPDERPRDPHMLKHLQEESSGVLAALVRGAMDYLKNGLQPPEKVTKYTREQRDNFDDIGLFLAEACVREDTPPPGLEWLTRTSASEFVDVCNWWLRKTGVNQYAISPKRVSQTLVKKGIPSKKSNTMQYLGVSIKPEVLDEFCSEGSQKKEVKLW